MAHFLMWMISFFTMTMTIFWKYMGLWFTWKDKDFLRVQSEYCKRLCKDIPRLEKCLVDMELSSNMKVLNKNQCVHLYRKFIPTIKGINEILSSATKDLKFQSLFEELCYLQKKVEIIGNNSIQQDQWCHLAIFQFQNKETFRELLLDLQCCYDTARDVYLFYHPNQSNDILPIQFDATSYQQVVEDGQVLKNRLELVLQGNMSKDYEIAQHLLFTLRNLDRIDGGDLDALEVPNDFNTLELINHIGGGVHTSNWLGLSCATKVCKRDQLFINSQMEFCILSSLSHPNLVHYISYGTKENLNEIVEENQTIEMYLVMEHMQSNLSTMLKNEKRPLPYHVALDIMHQIAKGVYYLHDMQVAHLDLKPDNVLYNSIVIEDLNPHCIFKVANYGTSPLEVYNNQKSLKPSKSSIEIPRYMSPEMINGNNTSLSPFTADVWSFAMICSEILSRKAPYSTFKAKEFYDQMSSTHGLLRPELPNNCEELTSLIKECWSQDPLRRPTFSNICKRLTSLKKSFLMGTYSFEMVPQFDSSWILTYLKLNLGFKKCEVDHVPKVVKNYEFDHVPKVDDPITTPPKEIPIDLHQQLSRAKSLLKMNYVGIVGMGGIGKTTLAKALFDDVAVTSSYHASCFVMECKNYQSSYEIMCKILSKLGNDQKPKNLEDAQMMMKELLVGKKVLLILDDVKDEALVHDIVPPHIVQASTGTTIIMTTRNWNTMKSFVGNKGKLDVELLDENVATMLFDTYLSWGIAPLAPDFEDLRKRIVRACNGLPLSLKQMGAFLRNKERLRSWERALQRMARGRNFYGDEEIWNILRICFDGLNDGVEKGMFLDVACFFCKDVYPSGITKATILSMWSKDGILPMRELERLIDMSLLKINGDGDILEMHDQLRDMGRMIAQGTRIWKASRIPESGFSSKDAEILEGISVQGIYHMPSLKQDQRFDFEKLRVLILGSTSGTFEAYIDNLDFLLQLGSQCSRLEAILIGNSKNWIGLPHLLPTNIAISLNKRILDLCATCTSLKILDLIGLGFLEQLPKKIVSSNTLLRLDLSYCSCLVALPKEVGNLSSLTTLNLEECHSLATLPKEVGELSLLSTLNLQGCSSLVALPKQVGHLSFLTTLNLRMCSSLVALPEEVGSLSSLTTLDLYGCSSLVALPEEVGSLSSLTTLDLYGCSSLVALPKEVGSLSSLTTLDLYGCSSLIALPEEVGSLSSLTTLDLYGCSSLIALPEEVGNLSSLTTLNLWRGSSLVAIPEEVGNLSFLRTLDLGECSSLVALPKEVGNLSSLTTLDLRGCSSLLGLPKQVGNLSSLTTLDLHGCSSLTTLPEEVESLSSLYTLDLQKCSKLVALPKEIGNLFSLTTLNFRGCLSLEILPKEVGNLSLLTTLDLRGVCKFDSITKKNGKLDFFNHFRIMWVFKVGSIARRSGKFDFF